MIAEAYGSFGHPAVAPLKQLDDNHWLLELFHGPTLAFKDVAMQLLARLMDWALAKRNDARHHRRRHLAAIPAVPPSKPSRPAGMPRSSSCIPMAG